MRSADKQISSENAVAEAAGATIKLHVSPDGGDEPEVDALPE